MEKKENISFRWPLVGNRQVTKYLEKGISNGRNLSGSYIFHGPDGLGKATLARHFAQILLCGSGGRELPCRQCPACRRFSASGGQADMGGGEHSDLHIMDKEADKKNIAVSQARDFIRKLGMSSFMNSYKIGIVKNADSLSIEAANALLKTLEEPKDKVIIIMIAGDLKSLPLTIVSRSQVLNFYPVNSEDIYTHLIEKFGAQRAEAKSLSGLSLGRPALAAKYKEDKEFLNRYERNVNVFLNFKDNDLNGRFGAIEALFDSKDKGQAAAAKAEKILDAWQGACRDLLLSFYGLDNLLQHKSSSGKIAGLGRSMAVKEIIGLNEHFREARENLAANVNPRTVLEEVALKLG